jgi:thiamine kinase-like enzyme
VTKVSGGITNILLKLTPGSQHLPVLVRVFGDHTDEVIDRDSEETISLQLHEAGFGAEVKHPRTHQQ